MSFDVEKARAQMALSNESAKAQREMNQEIIDSQLDAGDRIIMRKAADTVLTIAPAVAADPT